MRVDLVVRERPVEATRWTLRFGLIYRQFQRGAFQRRALRLDGEGLSECLCGMEFHCPYRHSQALDVLAQTALSFNFGQDVFKQVFNE